MDPVLTASAVVSALSPYLGKAAGKLAESAGGAAWEAGAKLFQALKQRLSGAPATGASQALADLEAEPGDADTQAALRKELKKLLASDPDLLRDLAALLPQAARASVVFDNQFHGSVGEVVQGQTITINKSA